jgi:hypothetical protein
MNASAQPGLRSIVRVSAFDTDQPEQHTQGETDARIDRR